MKCNLIGSGGYHRVYEKGGKNVYKVPIKEENLIYKIIETLSKELYSFLKKNNNILKVPNTKFVNIDIKNNGKIKIVQRKVFGNILDFNNIHNIGKNDFEKLVELYFTIRNKYNFEIDFVGPKGIDAAKNFKKPIFENIITNNGEMYLVDLGGMTLKGSRFNLYNLIEFGKILGINEDLMSKLEYEYLKVSEKNNIKNKPLILLDFLKYKLIKIL